MVCLSLEVLAWSRELGGNGAWTDPSSSSSKDGAKVSISMVLWIAVRRYFQSEGYSKPSVCCKLGLHWNME